MGRTLALFAADSLNYELQLTWNWNTRAKDETKSHCRGWSRGVKRVASHPLHSFLCAQYLVSWASPSYVAFCVRRGWPVRLHNTMEDGLTLLASHPHAPA